MSVPAAAGGAGDVVGSRAMVEVQALVRGERRYHASSLLAYLAHAMAGFGVVAWVHDTTGDSRLAGLAVGALLAPLLLLGLWAGSLADRMSRRRIVTRAQLVSIAASLALAVVALGAGAPSAILVVGIAVAYGIGMAFIPQTRLAMLANVTTPDRLRQATVTVSMVNTVALAAGPALAGTVAGVAGWPAAFLAIALCWAGSTVLAVATPTWTSPAAVAGGRAAPAGALVAAVPAGSPSPSSGPPPGPHGTSPGPPLGSVVAPSGQVGAQPGVNGVSPGALVPPFGRLSGQVGAQPGVDGVSPGALVPPSGQAGVRPGAHGASSGAAHGASVGARLGSLVPPAPPGVGTVGAVRGYLRGNPVVRSLIGMVAASIVLLFGPLQVLVPMFAGEVLDLDNGERGALMGVLGLGIVAGGVAATRAVRLRRLPRWLVGAAAVGMGLPLVLAGAGNVPTAALVLVVVGATGGFFASVAPGIVQAAVSDDIRGRIMATYVVVRWGLPALGAALAGVMADVLGLRGALALYGVLGVLLVAVTGRAFLRSLRPCPV